MKKLLIYLILAILVSCNELTNYDATLNDNIEGNWIIEGTSEKISFTGENNINPYIFILNDTIIGDYCIDEEDTHTIYWYRDEDFGITNYQVESDHLIVIDLPYHEGINHLYKLK